MAKNKVAPFFPDTVYIFFQYFNMYCVLAVMYYNMLLVQISNCFCDRSTQ